MPIATVTAGLTATKAALDLTKVLMDKLNTPAPDVHDIRAKVQEMLIHVVNAQVALGEANVEIADLRQQLTAQDDLKALAADMVFNKEFGFYVRQSDNSTCCPVCWGDKQRAVPMVPGYNGFFTCALHPTCVMQDKRRAIPHTGDEY